ncbi:hypothetical protein [Paenibacillus sp. OV219]|uniref:hypothetical protein n=1 Tax=Paenibacillus sp. OV219 TaxID=1884377 RepID=UPI0008CB9361|nr:hypothetical protein [Paenibacillus sp. OV219]SEN77850.1 hypothetical protein SAMN05518847_104117 [Paenibacillus sp. OV219]
MITSSTHTPSPESLPVNWRLFQICMIIVVACVRDVAAKTPRQLLFFAFGIDVIVDGLQQTGLIRFLASELGFHISVSAILAGGGQRCLQVYSVSMHGRIY